MALLGKAILGVWNETAPEDEADFNDWYLREHIIERTAVPGMTRGRRYRALEGSPKYMALYEARTLDVLTTGAYRVQLDNPTEWTKRVTSRFTFMRRAICDVIADSGLGVGGFAAIFHFHPTFGSEAKLRAWAEQLVPALAGMTQVAAAHCWVGDPGEPATPTSALSARAVSDKPVGWVLAIEAGDLDGLCAARDAVLASDPVAHGTEDLQAYPLYQLLYVLESAG